MNKRAAMEATKATMLATAILVAIISIIWLAAFMVAHRPAWGLFTATCALAAGFWWMVYRDESR